MFQLLLEGDPCSRNESFVQNREEHDWVTRSGHENGKNEVNYPAGMWSDCARGSLAADGGGTAWPEMQMHLVDNKIQ